MANLLDGFDWTTPFIADACVQLSLPVRIAPFGLKPNIAASKAAGPACPSRHAGSTDVFLEAIAAARQGDVLVIDNGGRTDEGCIGDLVVGEAFMSGLAATVCWGTHRDTGAILAFGARVWSLGTCPNGPLELRKRVPTALEAANLGSITVTKDDYVFADDDGVVIVAAGELERIVTTARDIAGREGAQAARLMKGELLRQQLDLDQYVAKRNSYPDFTFREHLKSFGGAIEISPAFAEATAGEPPSASRSRPIDREAALFQDLRYGLRLMTRRPGFAAIAVATLALGIGTTTAIFAVTDHVLLRPVPYTAPDRLAVIWETSPTIQLPVMYASPPALADWQQRSRTFSAIGGFQWRDVTMGGAEPERIRGARVTAGLLQALDVQPRMGRWFLPEEDRANARPVVLISDALWKRRFQGNPSIVGHTIPIDGVPTEIIGVMPPSFACPPAVVLRGTPPAEPAELWIPHATDLAAGQRGAHYLAIIGRLATGSTFESADREMNAIQEQIEREVPDYKTWRARVVPLVDEVTSSSRRAVGLLVAAVAFVLLLACANVANLLLARGVGRRKEFAIRTALGAGRARLAMQVIAEVFALATAGGIAGALLAAGLIRVMVLLGPASMPGLQSTVLDARTLLFAIGASILAAMLAGAIPAAGAMRTRLASWLADRSGGSGPGTLRAQQLLAVGQIGLAVALLVTAALLVESFRQLRSVDPGFKPAQVTTAKLTLAVSRYPDGAARSRFVDQALAGLRSLPGVSSAAVIDAVPIADNRQGTSLVRLDGPPADPTASQNANIAWITEGYFETLGIPLIAGRTFTAEDTSGRDRVVVINRLLARQVFGDADPVGRMVRVGASTQSPFQVIGVVGDEHHVGVDAEATPSFFIALRQVPSIRDLSIVVRSSGTPAAAASSWTSLLGPLAPSVSEAIARESVANLVRTAIRRIDPDLALFRLSTMEQVIDASVATPRSMAWLLSAFAVAALLLAAIGVFGVMSHAVSQRTREIGVRMAIGASPYRMLGAILGEGLAQVGLGLIAGGILSLVTARLLTGLLFGVSALSLTPYFVVMALLMIVSLIACLVPARRAMRIDPASALRAD